MDDMDLLDLDNFSEDMLFDIGDMGDGAYIKREVRHFRPVYCVYDLRGQLLAEAPTRHAAFLMIRRNALTPYDAH